MVLVLWNPRGIKIPGDDGQEDCEPSRMAHLRVCGFVQGLECLFPSEPCAPILYQKRTIREFPGGPVVIKTWAFTAVDPGSIPSQETKTPQTTRCGPLKKRKARKKENDNQTDASLNRSQAASGSGSQALQSALLSLRQSWCLSQHCLSVLSCILRPRQTQFHDAGGARHLLPSQAFAGTPQSGWPVRPGTARTPAPSLSCKLASDPDIHSLQNLLASNLVI